LKEAKKKGGFPGFLESFGEGDQACGCLRKNDRENKKETQWGMGKRSRGSGRTIYVRDKRSTR